MFGLPGNSHSPAAGSALQRWIARRVPHPDAFDCGVRVVDGAIDGLGPRWHRRRSAADPLIVDGIATLTHGVRELRLRLDPDQRQDGRRIGIPSSDVVLSAQEITSGAHVMISVGVAELGRFGIDLR